MKILPEGEGIEFKVQRWFESPNLNNDLIKQFKDIELTQNVRGAWVRKTTDGRVLGPFAHASAVSSIEVGKYFQVPARMFLAFQLALLTGIHPRNIFSREMCKKFCEERKERDSRGMGTRLRRYFETADMKSTKGPKSSIGYPHITGGTRYNPSFRSDPSTLQPMEA